MKAGDTIWWLLLPGAMLEPGDRIKTGVGSNALITFFEGSTIYLKEGTEIGVTELSITDKGSTTIRLWQQIGKTRSRVEKLIDPASRYEIETPAGAAVVRGSVGDVNVDKYGNTTIFAVKDQWWAIAQGVEVLILEGQKSIIVFGQEPSAASSLPETVQGADPGDVGGASSGQSGGGKIRP